MLLKALEMGDMNLISMALKDKIHQIYRATLIHELDDVAEICIVDGSSAIFVSGSGPTLMNIITDDKFPEIIKDGISKLKYEWEIKLLETDKNGVVVEKS